MKTQRNNNVSRNDQRPHTSHIPRKRFGQHFLSDANVIRQIVQAVAPQPSDTIVEIGPGQAALTLPLLRQLNHLTVVELDRDLIPGLNAAATGIGQLHIINADVLTLDFTALAHGRSLRIVGNLPYNISSPILFHCLEHIDVIRDMHFMLQKEVVERMAAAPGSKTYGRLSVMLQLICSVDALFTVPASAFRPPPKVESAVVRLTPLAQTARPDLPLAIVKDVVRGAFSQRRKTLANALSSVMNTTQIEQAGIDSRLRAEQLAPADYIALARQLISP